MKIGDKFTWEEFNLIKKNHSKTTFTGDYYILSNDLRFDKIDNDMWELTSTFDSRVADQDNGHPSIHRQESKYTKGYYETKT